MIRNLPLNVSKDNLLMALDKGIFRKVMGQFATGVTIATTRNQGSITGLTVNSFTSVSLDPPLVLICVDLRSQSLPLLRESGVFAVNILTQEQEALSNCFASTSDERTTYFCHARHHVAATGSPILDDSLAFIDSRITAEYPGGDHVIFVGQVEAIGYDGEIFFMPGVNREQSTLPTRTRSTSNNGHRALDTSPAEPLLYYQGSYHHLSRHYEHEHPELSAVQTPQTAHE
jgi:flavin reductase (DIM6/NTAB) family NADH-FMN oxidoreductase RutF